MNCSFGILNRFWPIMHICLQDIPPGIKVFSWLSFQRIWIFQFEWLNYRFASSSAFRIGRWFQRIRRCRRIPSFWAIRRSWGTRRFCRLLQNSRMLFILTFTSVSSYQKTILIIARHSGYPFPIRSIHLLLQFVVLCLDEYMLAPPELT
jgi:hypothetical protein